MKLLQFLDLTTNEVLTSCLTMTFIINEVYFIVDRYY